MKPIVPTRAQLKEARVLVVGDSMLDRYWFGAVERISPEAPVPVVRVNTSKEQERLGGAANVAWNVKALGAHPVILTGTRDNRLKIGLELGADHVVNARQENAVEAVRKLNGGKGVDYVVECSGAPNAVNEAIRMVNRGGKVCLAAFPHEETPVDVAHIVRNNIYVFGIRGEGKSATHRAEAFMSQKRFDATKVHTHTFPLEDLPTAIKYARERIDDAIKVVVKTRGAAAQRVAAE